MEKHDEPAYSDTIEMILNECKGALMKVDEASVQKLIEMIIKADKVFFTGVGRVLISLQAIVKRFTQLDIESYYVGQIDEPPISGKDLLIVGSSSGESLFPVAIARKAATMGIKIVHIGSNPHSSLEPITDLFIRIPVRTKLHLEDEIDSQQPMTSLFEQCLLIFGDALAKLIIAKKSINEKELYQKHANLE